VSCSSASARAFASDFCSSDKLASFAVVAGVYTSSMPNKRSSFKGTSEHRPKVIDSKALSYTRNPMFGNAIGRQARKCSKAWRRGMPCLRIRYAQVMVLARDLPAKQWIKTRLFGFYARTSSIQLEAVSKYYTMFWSG